MTQPASDLDLDSDLSGTNFRTELNTLLLSLFSMMAGSSDPPASAPFMLYADTGASPNEITVRNPGDTAYIKLAEIDTDSVTLFSDGAAVVGLANSASFTENQAVDKSGSAGQLSVGSSLDTGIVARIPLFGHNSSGDDTTGINLVARLTTNTASAETFQFEIEVVTAGSATTRLVVGSTTTVTGTFNATTLQQGGTSVDDLVADDLSSSRSESTVSGTTQSIITQAACGIVYRVTASSNCTFTIGSQPRGGSWAIIINDSNGASDITFSSAAGPNDVDFDGGTTLAGVASERPMCTLVWSNGGDDVNIRGDNS